MALERTLGVHKSFKGTRGLVRASCLGLVPAKPDPECGRDSIVVDNTVEKTSERDGC